MNTSLRSAVAIAAWSIVGFGPSACAEPVPTAGNTLFLTWHDDPTTTMVAQWLELGTLPEAMPGSSDDASFATPRLPGPITIDGDGEDWGTAGLRLDYLAQPDGQWPDPAGMAATAKLGWTPDGLAALIHVVDDEATEDPDAERIWRGDSVEFFLGRALDHPDAIQIVVAPGMDPATPGVRIMSLDRSSKPRALTFEADATRTDAGYAVELLVPWGDLFRDGDAPRPGDTLTCQLIVNDRDGPFDREQLAWYPAVDSYRNRRSMQTLRLAEQPDTTVRLLPRARFDQERGRLVIDLGGEPRLIGETVVLRSGERVLGEVELEDVLGFAGAVVPLPVDERGEVPRIDAVSVHLDDRVVGRALLPRDTWRQTPPAVTVRQVSDHEPDAAAQTSEALPFGETGWFVQRVSMNGLSPDTEYLLEVPGHEDPVLFRTAPATLDRPLVFAEGGDVGTSRVVGELHDQAAKWDPLFGLVGGDCAYGNGVDPVAWLRYLRLWHDHMVTEDGRSIPMLCTIGNHEVAGGYNKTKEHAPFFHALFGPLFPNRGTYQTLDFADYLSLFMLDSGHTHQHGGQQTRWLDRALTDRADVTHRLVAYHVPAYPSHRAYDGQFSVEAREHWVPLFDRHQVDVVFEHHDHTYKRTHLLRANEPHPEGILYLGDGAWGRPPRSVNPDLPYLAVAKSSLNVIRVELGPDGSRSYLAVDENGAELDRYPVEEE